MDEPHPLMILLQLALFGLFVAEMIAFARLTPWYAARGRHSFPLPDDFPESYDEEALLEFAGSTESSVYRWDPEEQAILFRRKFGPIKVHEGSVVGCITLGPKPAVRWRTMPGSILIVLTALILAGAFMFAVVEGNMLGGTLVVGGGLPVVLLIRWFLRFGARRCLRLIVPEISEALRTAGVNQEADQNQ